MAGRQPPLRAMVCLLGGSETMDEAGRQSHDGTPSATRTAPPLLVDFSPKASLRQQGLCDEPLACR
jgi:hypothetical protein